MQRLTLAHADAIHAVAHAKPMAINTEDYVWADDAVAIIRDTLDKPVIVCYVTSKRERAWFASRTEEDLLQQLADWLRSYLRNFPMDEFAEYTLWRWEHKIADQSLTFQLNQVLNWLADWEHCPQRAWYTFYGI